MGSDVPADQRQRRGCLRGYQPLRIFQRAQDQGSDPLTWLSSLPMAEYFGVTCRRDEWVHPLMAPVQIEQPADIPIMKMGKGSYPQIQTRPLAKINWGIKQASCPETGTVGCRKPTCLGSTSWSIRFTAGKMGAERANRRGGLEGVRGRQLRRPSLTQSVFVRVSVRKARLQALLDRRPPRSSC